MLGRGLDIVEAAEAAGVSLPPDRVEVKRQFSERFGEVTMLAAVTGPGADGFVNRFVH
jgi:hypothetical protein